MLKEYKSLRIYENLRGNKYISHNLGIFLSKYAREVTNFDSIKNQKPLIRSIEEANLKYNKWMVKANKHVDNDENVRSELLREKFKSYIT
jgi:hypothetical protein